MFNAPWSEFSKMPSLTYAHAISSHIHQFKMKVSILFYLSYCIDVLHCGKPANVAVYKLGTNGNIVFTADTYERWSFAFAATKTIEVRERKLYLDGGWGKNDRSHSVSARPNSVPIVIFSIRLAVVRLMFSYNEPHFIYPSAARCRFIIVIILLFCFLRVVR